ncbi:MAG TPA: anthranilate synthase component II [Flavobacteriia bacterium]|nr:anthranilate synthase component II [Flavobacteriia bacterium]
MKILLVDHNDSFTYNILELIRKFKSVTVDVEPYNKLDLKKVAKYDKIILSPGPQLPKDYPKSKALIQKYYQQKPILGICLGHQILSEFFGWNLYNLKVVKHGVKEEIIINNQTLLYHHLPPKINVGLYHSWAVKEHKKNQNLQITATNKNGVIMSVQHKKLPIFGVQYHLESFLTESGKNMMENFLFNA